jgi:eukaryotic-like serine/threonine-protein kinase
MAIVSCTALLDVIRHLQFLDDAQAAEALALGGGRAADVRVVAKAMIQRGWLTVFQVNQLLAGYGPALRIGPYLILDRLGKGGQSEVYKARHVETGWVVALKVIRASQLTAPLAARQFLEEMMAMAELNHPNIVQFWDVDKADDAYYCAMEFIEGTDLGKVVQLQGRLPPAIAAEYTRQAALGLQHAYEHCIVHRDIKPSNLYLTQAPIASDAPKSRSACRSPLVKILDWGLARFPLRAQAAVANGDEAVDQIVGTADYMAPEQASNPGVVDIRADVYSLGCSLYYLLTGHPPFAGSTVLQKIMKHQSDVAEPVEQVNPDVPSELANLVRRLMAKAPQQRCQTPVAVALALAPFCRREQPNQTRRSLAAGPQPKDRRRPRDDTPPLSATITRGLPRPLRDKNADS